MTEPGDRDRFLADEMLRNANVILEVTRDGRATFLEERDVRSRYAVEHAAELIAEAGKTTSEAFQRLNPGFPWRRLGRFRREVAHPYDSDSTRVSREALWQFASRDVQESGHRPPAEPGTGNGMSLSPMRVVYILPTAS